MFLNVVIKTFYLNLLLIETIKIIIQIIWLELDENIY